MNKRDKNNAEFLRKALQPLDEKTAAPEAISADSIAELVSGKPQKKSKRGKMIALKTVSSVAAAVILAIGIGTAINYFNKPAIDQMPDAVADAVTPVSSNTEQTVIEYFTALKANNDRIKVQYVFDEALDFGVKADDAAAPESALGTNSNASTSSTSDSSYGTTNTQVSGIDEDDIIKNDGRYIYILTDSTVKIVDAQNMELMSKFDIDNRGSNGLYIHGNTLAVIGSTFDKKQQTVIELYDISDKSKPTLKNSFSQDGSYFSSRLIDGKIILLSQHTVYTENIRLDDGYAVYEDVAPAISKNGVAQIIEPDMITILPQDENYSETYTVMSTVELESAEFSPVTSALLGTGSELYCTAQNLYITATRYTYSKISENGTASLADQKVSTVIHRFSINGGTIKAEATGEVSGRVHNQFSLDETGGYLRVATTNSEANEITVLDMQLKEVAKITDIAEGETIQSVRYIGDYGYVVTFRQTDPLFVIDFKDMKNPKIVGELKIPGFSSYLHPFNGYLVGIGTDGDENGTVNALKISLFDISDPTDPQEIDRFIVQNAYAESYHKAVMDCTEKNILGFIYRDYETGEAKLCTLRIKEGKTELIGSYSNRTENESYTGTVYSPDGESELIYYDKSSYSAASIERATYIGDTLYTVSSHRICAYPLEGGAAIATLDF